VRRAPLRYHWWSHSITVDSLTYWPLQHVYAHAIKTRGLSYPSLLTYLLITCYQTHEIDGASLSAKIRQFVIIHHASFAESVRMELELIVKNGGASNASLLELALQGPAHAARVSSQIKLHNKAQTNNHEIRAGNSHTAGHVTLLIHVRKVASGHWVLSICLGR